jgi:hypothetical protein
MVFNNVFLVQGTTVIVQGNYILGTNGTIQYVFAQPIAVESLLLEVFGCAQINGNVNIQLTQPPSGTATVPIITYHNLCASKRSEISKRQLISPEQLKLELTYLNSECDEVNAYTYDTENATFLTVEYLGNKCQTTPSTTSSTIAGTDSTKDSGVNKNLIIGLSVGLGGGFIVIAFVILLLAILYRKKSTSRDSGDSFVDNPSFKNGKQNDSGIEMNI